ncbi:hypothetical protein BH10BAC3_BH10BAC3_26920 [soil metagenome]
MKPTFLFFVLLFGIVSTQTSSAQETQDSKSQKIENIPFGKQLPPPVILNHSDNLLPQITEAHMSASAVERKRNYDAKQITKGPDYFKQLFAERRKMQASLVAENKAAMPKKNGASNAKSSFHMIEDINALAESNPHNYMNNAFDISFNFRSDPFAPYAVAGNVAFFQADDGIHGSELWRSDGSSVGTWLVKDLEAGSGSAYLNDITAVNGKVYFSAYVPSYGWGVWVTDGTEMGTQVLAVVREAKDFFKMGDKTYFIADSDDFFLSTIWETDGTPAGTKNVLTMENIGAYGEQVGQPTLLNGLLYFTFLNYETLRWELWRSDLTEAGTFHVGPGYPVFDENYNILSNTPAQLTSYHNKIYFSANDGNGRKLWVSDGTDEGTTLATGNNDVLISADYLGTSFPVLNNVLFMPGGNGSEGNELYKYDASGAAELVKVTDISTSGDKALIVPFEMQVANNILYFKVSNDHGGLHDELWSSQGSAATTKAIKISQPGEAIKSLYNCNKVLFFVAGGTQYGNELWTTNGTAAGTVLVSNIFKGATSSYPAYLSAFNGKLMFSAADAVHGNEVFITDGTDKGTALVKDINTVSTTGSNAGFNYYGYLGYKGLIALGNDVLFNAYERVHGYELYKSNGTSGGTQVLTDIVPGEAGFIIRNFISKGNTVWFYGISSANNSVYGSKGKYSIYKTDGKPNGLQKITPDYNNMQSFAVADNGLVYYVIFNGSTYEYELWRSDGTTGGTFLLSSTLYYSNYLTNIGNTALFIAGDATHGYELWKSDGTIGGTQILKDINPGSANMLPGGGMFAYKNEVYFAASDGAGVNPSFWKSNGTEAGTIKLKDIDPWWGRTVAANAEYFCISNGILYFSAIDHSNDNGTAFYKTDGTAGGTQFIKDMNPNSTDPYSPNPSYITDINGTLYFVGNDGAHGRELWKSDGTNEGTQLVKDITEGMDGSSIDGLTKFAGKLYFRNVENKDGFYRYYLWSSDGTPDGTNEVEGFGISNIAAMLAAGDNLYLTVYTSQYGAELYVGKADDKKEKFVPVTLAQKVVPQENFSLLLYPNPAHSKATLQLPANLKNPSISITDIQGKIVWQSSSNTTRLVNLPTEKLAAGVYMVTVKSGAETRNIKFVKE